MKVIHTSDWHLGHQLYNWDRTDEHQLFFDELVKVIESENPDALVVCGDIYHTIAPSASTQKLYIDNMLRIHAAAPDMTIVITAGNHDSSARLEVDKSIWKHFNLHVIGSVARKGDLQKHIIPVGNPAKGYILAVPHCYPQNFPDTGEDLPREKRPAAFYKALLDHVDLINNRSLPVIMTAHTTVIGSDPRKQDIIVGGIDSIDIRELGEGFDYLALGHIHFPQTIAPGCRYSGSPIPVSFNEDYTHSITIVELDEHGISPVIRTRKMPTLRPVITIPENEPAEFEEVLRLLEQFPDEKEAYIRLNVKVKQYGGADWAAKASAVTQTKKCRYCCIQLQSIREDDSDQAFKQFSQEEMKALNPIEIAKLHWKQTNGCDMDAELQDKILSVICDKEEE